MAFPVFLAKLLARCGLAHLVPSVQRLTDGGGAFLRYWSDGLLHAPHSDLRELLAFRQGLGGDLIDLAAPAPDFELVPASTTRLPADRRVLPPVGGTVELKTAVAEHLGAVHGLRVQPAGEVLITPGVAGALQLVLHALLNPGDRVVLFDPASPLYRFTLRHHGVRIHWVRTWTEDGRLLFDPQNLADALRGARLILVNSPSNPGGGVFFPQELERIAWWADRRDVVVVSDEIFARYRYQGEPVSIAGLPRAVDRTLTAGSLSKGHGLPGIRVGWLAGHRHLIRPCLLTAALQGTFVPAMCEQAALAALETPESNFDSIRNDFDQRRQYVVERLQSMGLKPHWPAGGHFVWVSIDGLGFTAQQFADQLRNAARVVIWPGHHFGPSGRDHIRISYAGNPGRLRQGLSRLDAFVGQLRAGIPLSARKMAA